MLKKYWPVLFTLYMTLVGGNFLLYNLALPIRILHHVAMTGVLVYWFWKHGLPNSPMLLPAGGMAAAVLLSVPGAVDSRMALENAWHWIINLGMFLLLIDWCRRGYVNHLFGGLFASGGVLAGSSLLQGLIMPATRVSGVFGLVNLTGGYSAASAVPAFGWASSMKSRKMKVALGAVVAGLIATVFANQSRGALLSLGVSVLVAFAPTIFHHRKLLLVAIPAVVSLAGVILLWTANGHNTGDGLRTDLWRAATQMISQNPLGVGVGDFGQVYRQMTTVNNPDHLDIDGMTGAHDLYLNLGAEMGGPGLAAGAAFLLVVVHFLFKTSWNMQKLAVLAALAGILVHMLVDNFPAQNWTFLVSLYVAFLVSDHRLNFKPKALSRLAAVIVLLYGVKMLTFDRAQSYYEQSLNGDVVAALHAMELDPDLRLYQMNVARMEGGLQAAERLDPTVSERTNLTLYGLVNYGRYWS